MKDSFYLRKRTCRAPNNKYNYAVLVTIGNAKSKKSNGKKIKFTMIFFGAALLLILSRSVKLFWIH
jgi:hypothetical protein